jgi:hypothetical protein
MSYAKVRNVTMKHMDNPEKQTNELGGVAQSELIKNETRLPVGDNRVQKRLMELWASGQSKKIVGNNSIALAWMGAGLADHFRLYADSRKGLEIDIGNEAEMANLLKEVTKQTRH